MPTTPPASRAVPIAGFYLAYFASVGVLLPFLPAYLKSLSLTTTEVGVLLAISPTFALFAPPFWAHLADRSGRPERVLSFMGLGAALCFAPLLVVRDFSLLALALSGYAFFASSVTVMIDSIALRHVASSGGAYARLRLFGSIGFVVSSALFGFSVARVNEATIVVALALMASYFLWSFTLRDGSAPVGQPVSPWSGLRLLRRRELSLFLATTCLHWIACAPYHGNLAIHVTALGLPPWVVGLAAAVGVIAEIAVMYAYPRLGERLAPRHVLFVSFAASAARWAGMAVAADATSIIALSLLHGLTFGSFYVAAVSYLTRHVPGSLRATGQALFVSITFGLGGLAGFVSAGAGYDLFGGPRLFGLAAALELVAALLALGLRAPPAPER